MEWMHGWLNGWTDGWDGFNRSCSLSLTEIRLNDERKVITFAKMRIGKALVSWAINNVDV